MISGARSAKHWRLRSRRFIHFTRISAPRLALRTAVAAGAAALAVPASVALAAEPASSPVRGTAPAAVRIIVVRSLASSGPRTLRSAIKTANSLSGVTIIDFGVAGVIKLASALPAIAGHIVIDARTAPGHKAGGPPVVEIDCNGHPGLRFGRGSGGAALAGFAIGNASGSGVTLTSRGAVITANYIGLNLAGTAFGNRGDGVFASRSASGNAIGLNLSGVSGAVTNVISANRGSGIVLDGSSGNTVEANRIGTNPAGTEAIPNGRDGLQITSGADGNEIGGTEFTNAATGKTNNPTGSEGTTTPVFVVPPLGNLISGNSRDGVLISGGAQGNMLNGNFIGTTADGDSALGNRGNGVWINKASFNSLIGCKFTNNPFVYYNVVSGNGGNGILITNSGNVTVQGNFFGTAADNDATIGNRLNGIKVANGSRNTQIGGVIPLGNVSGGNGLNGIAVTTGARGFTTFNTFGGLFAFGGAAPNGRDGVLITSAGGNNLVRTNVLSGNRRNGLELGANATGVTVDPDIAGMDTEGTAPLANGRDGVLIDGNANHNIIGGSLRSVIRQNTFSGNKSFGLVITGTAHDNRVFTSYIGVEILGTKPAANGRGGVLVSGSAYRNVIGNIKLHPANLISANTGNGVTLLASTRHNRVVSNFVGLSRFGKCLPNSGRQIVNLNATNLLLHNRICRK